MFAIKHKKTPSYLGTKSTSQGLTVDLRPNGVWVIGFNPSNPPEVIFDTNVLRDLNPSSVDSLRQLQAERGFRYRYSMLNFVELVSHLADPPTKDVGNPFAMFQCPFKRMKDLFDLNVLPSAEETFLTATGLKHYLGPKWIVDPAFYAQAVNNIASANTIDEILKNGIDPAHYKKLRECDGESFLYLTDEAIKLAKTSTEWWGKWVSRFVSFQIFRASSQKTRLESLTVKEQTRMMKFFVHEEGKMFAIHLRKLMERAIKGGGKIYANDFYDMLQLFLVVKPNLLFVTDDRAFRRYYAGPRHHKVISWKGFKASVGK
jgi:hypothetical protein